MVGGGGVGWYSGSNGLLVKERGKGTSNGGKIKTGPNFVQLIS